MNFDEIMTFLQVVEAESISVASNKLFISQSTASSRIQNLEADLGVTLIHRAKGYKKITLTEEGEYFLPIAQQWLALYNDIKNIRNINYVQTFKITANAILNYYLLPYIYNDFSNKHTNIMIYSQTEHSTEAHKNIANQVSDLALVYTEHYEPNVISTPIFEEDMVIICHKKSKFAKTRNLNDLIDSNEVYAKWSNEFESWHQSQFPYARRYKIVIGSAMMFSDFLIEKEDWAFVSRLVGDKIHTDNPDFITVDYPNLPKRTVYILTHKYPKPGTKKLKLLFENELKEYLKHNPSIRLIEKL